MKKQIPLNVLIKLIGFYSLIIGIIGTILVLGFSFTQQQKTPTPTPTPTPTVTPSITNSPTDYTNSSCGGFVGQQCPEGYACEYPNNGSSLGKCVKKP